MLITAGESFALCLIILIFAPGMDFETMKKVGVYFVLLVIAMVNLNHHVHQIGRAHV
jgi:hypothetical protein